MGAPRGGALMPENKAPSSGEISTGGRGPVVKERTVSSWARTKEGVSVARVPQQSAMRRSEHKRALMHAREMDINENSFLNNAYLVRRPKLVLCQVCFYDSRAFKHSGHGLFPKKRHPLVGTARSRTFSMDTQGP
ncbi:hypothetical protein CEN47_17990, partial [Fischerella thermalis CCMEE 5319]